MQNAKCRMQNCALDSATIKTHPAFEVGCVALIIADEEIVEAPHSLLLTML